MEIALFVVVVLLAGVVVVQATRKPKGASSSPVAAPAISADELSARVELAAQKALTEAVARLNAQAEQDRKEAIRLATESVTKSGQELLDTKAQVIDATLRGVSTDVTKRLNELNTELQNLRESSSRQYGSVEEAVSALAKRTDNLKDILSNSQKRGQWGERLAEDILRSAGFVEGKNYSKQQQIEGGGKPDYRFEMPPDRVLFMDVKFPLDQYSQYVASEDEAVRAIAKRQFLDALHGHITALAKRDYVDNDNNTIDYVLMFVPNESISSFVHEADPQLIDTALEQKVVLCTPLTLYAFLVVIRQATDSFHTEQNAADIMRRINLFNKEWTKYTEAVESVEEQFKKMLTAIESINVDGTRFKKLNVQVREIEKIRKREGIEEVSAADVEVLEIESGEE
ncbi:MAG: DNA recombination protein RmuC [Actinobacteria bacterium]|nr:DNA recombination protein RmuC [Actinomycetota bacterium]